MKRRLFLRGRPITVLDKINARDETERRIREMLARGKVTTVQGKKES